MMERVVITGANGFIGSALTAYLTARGVEVYAIVKDENEDISAIRSCKNVRVICCDILSIDRLTELTAERGFDCWYHLAWIGVSRALRSNDRVQIANITATAEALRTAEALGCRKFIGIGSFMEKEAYISVESNGRELNPAYLYGACKLSAKMVAKLLAGTMALDFCWGTVTNAYGGGDPDEGFMNYVLRNIISHTPVKLTACEQIYDFLYIEDVAKALCLIGEHGRNNTEYIIGSGNARPLKEFVNELLRTLGAEGLAEFGAVPFKGVGIEPEMMDTAGIRRDCGFEPEVTFEDGVKRTYEWLCRSQKNKS